MTASPDDRTAQVDETETAPEKATAKRAPASKQTPDAADASVKTSRTPAAKRASSTKPATKKQAAKKPAATGKATAAKKPAAARVAAKPAASKARPAAARTSKAAAEKAAPTADVVVEPLAKALADIPEAKTGTARTTTAARTAAAKNTAAATTAKKPAAATSAARAASARTATSRATGATAAKKTAASKTAAAKAAAAKSAAAKAAASQSSARSATAKTTAAKTAAAKSAATKAAAAAAAKAAKEEAEAAAVVEAGPVVEAPPLVKTPASEPTPAVVPEPAVDPEPVIEAVAAPVPAAPAADDEVEVVEVVEAEIEVVEVVEAEIEAVEIVEPVAEAGDAASDAVGPLDASSAGEAISIRGLVKQFGDNRAVGGIDLTVSAGSFYGVVGPNGAGKTTTLSIVAGLLRADAGSVVICGIDQATQPQAAKRLMGVLPDRLRTFDRLTGRQLLYYYGLLRGLASDVIEKRAADLARAFDLGDALSRVVSDYSAGMTKKIMLAGAMIHSPRVLVLDEPFESVDPVSSAVILDILRAYVAHGGTVILSSHGMDLVERVCSRVAIIVGGEVLAEGTIDEVRAGQTLESRFVELAGTSGEVEGLEWLHTFSD
ncbi:MULTISPECIES: ABC transporter ATP-binding protein [unclassified Microbacterium]|uniref:ABC transporter ATP-binding protein n=1 Tax=unclassified Microbacterium TaxID=2609290 RepID=UPI00301ACB2F